jgi:exopolysaccharide biosynthesis predicted pyruvyltransferase EpsI
MDGWYECLQDTSSRFAEQLRADLDDPGRKRAVVLVDIPLHTNLGDVFMVLGEIRALMKLGMLFRVRIDEGCVVDLNASIIAGTIILY